jgi:pyruvate carboxylase subunit B
MALKKIRFMDTSFRDGFQSVYGARVITKDFLPAFEASLEAGIKHFEFGGGARFQSLYFYCQEDAFDMMDTLAKIAGPGIDLQTLSRGISVVALKQQPRDIIDLHAKMFKKHGTTIIRNFDALNDMRNLEYSGERIVHHGLHHQISVALMGLPPGIKDKTVHTAEFYASKVEDIVKRGIPYNSLVFKDASGTCPPQIVKDSVKKAREILGKDATIWFHTHDTAGIGIAQNMAAIEGGADGIDLSKSPASGGTCQPDILSMWQAMRNTEYTLDIDYQKILKASRVFEDSMSHYLLPPEAKEVSPYVVLSPMPGGALTANTMMMRDTNTLDKYPKVIEEMAEVVALGGFGSSVTPVSQFYFQQAYQNVVFGKWKKIAPGYGEMVLGYFGETPRPADPEVIKVAAAQLKKEPFTGDPLDVIPPGIPAAEKILKDNNLPVTEENVFIIASCEGKGLDFLQGKAPLSVYYKADEPKVEVKQVTAKKDADLGPAQNMLVNVNGKDYNVTVRAEGAIAYQPVAAAPAAAAEAPKAEAKPAAATIPANAEVIKAPMPGNIFKILVKVGQEVKVGTPLLVFEAMKMENEIQTDKGGKVTQILVKEGEAIEEGKVLIVVE